MPAPDARLMEHEYDGIREYDNPTPGWWHAIFLGSVVFSAWYMIHYHMDPETPSLQQVWKQDQVREYQRLFGTLGDLKPDVPTMQMLQKRSDMMAVAQGMFVGNCAQCHAKDGGGINGVNLTDDSYKNVKVMPDIFTVITNGANNGAMPSWKNNFSDNERVLLAAYVASLRGTTPANPKQAEGSPIPPWPAP